MDDLPVNYWKLTQSEKRTIRERYVLEQDGKCFYCEEFLGGSPPKRITRKKVDWDLFPTGFLNHPIHLQHNHTTDMTEGAVHAYCNAVMWQYGGR